VIEILIYRQEYQPYICCDYPHLRNKIIPPRKIGLHPEIVADVRNYIANGPVCSEETQGDNQHGGQDRQYEKEFLFYAGFEKSKLIEDYYYRKREGDLL